MAKVGFAAEPAFHMRVVIPWFKVVALSAPMASTTSARGGIGPW